MLAPGHITVSMSFFSNRVPFFLFDTMERGKEAE